MKQYRFIGDPNDWNWDRTLVKGKIYPSNFVGFSSVGIDITVADVADDEPLEWEEVPND